MGPCDGAFQPRPRSHVTEGADVQLGLIGLGKMGGNMAERIRRAGHEVVGYDHAPGKRDVDSLPALVEALSAPRVVWVMVPSGEPTRATVKELAELLEPGDVIVDGGNSKYTDDQVHDVLCRDKGIGYVDAGVSGGVWGLENGYALMVGGTAEDVAKVQPVFDALKPPAPTDESGQEVPGDAGFVHAGPVGAGHFSKMVHNGIEYALMQAYGEGYELLEAVDLIEDVPGVIKSWTQGTVIRSWLLDLLVRALEEDPSLERVRGYAEDSGEGRWTVEQAIENAVPMPTIAASLFARFSSRQEDSPTMKAVAALRNQFGGHAVRAVQQAEAERPA
ncbi:decarboxylating 6-phosphogluconate dehydrogenase [Blastococcus sp. TML/C7B]|uniref:phosphogluconate dehydrogenase (NAD(+)-dependent, decarboxylating) n=2 Tax=unclassified Blastococcus TaxID=2619396 RepID=UPI00190BD930|nr:decarboxylating 6-phosphogluconate dehydrogenase [Blastococcus sp. TML/C7B]MBN1095429.1 decarboxylating 6-phosphogluconate dehydrogenase [Blastococcus sp. TML/C7B]